VRYGEEQDRACTSIATSNAAEYVDEEANVVYQQIDIFSAIRQEDAMV
jgi:hypothetical protein